MKVNSSSLLVLPQARVEAWYTLQKRSPRSRVSGQIQIGVSLIDVSGGNLPHQRID